MTDEQASVEFILDQINDAQKEVLLIRRNIDSSSSAALKRFDTTNNAFGFLNSARLCFADWKEKL